MAVEKDILRNEEKAILCLGTLPLKTGLLPIYAKYLPTVRGKLAPPTLHMKIITLLHVGSSSGFFINLIFKNNCPSIPAIRDFQTMLVFYEIGYQKLLPRPVRILSAHL